MRSKLDQIYRSVLLTKLFTQGWGKPENLRKIFDFRKVISNRDTCIKLVDKNHEITITKKIDYDDHYILEAEFVSPLVYHLPNLLPKESEKAYFQMILPKQWESNLKPTCLHLAGTGDHGYWRRRMLSGKPLLQEFKIASIIHENPFYGIRKPRDQLRSCLHNVSDLFLMGCCLVLESLVILYWAQRQGLEPLGITGISMGGHMASLAACAWPEPIALIPCLSWSTASGVFTQGVLSGAINWEKLKDQYFSDKVFRDELFNMIQSPEGHFRVYHEVGQQFAREYPKSLKSLENETVMSNHLEVQSGAHLNSNNIFSRLKLLENLKQKLNMKKRSSNLWSQFNHFQELHPVTIRPSTAIHTQPVFFEPYVDVRDPLTWEALQFMRGIMDECTHLGNFSKPIDTELVIIVKAIDDAYMPTDGFIPLTEIWPGSELRTLNTGHISAFLFNQQMFRIAIRDAFLKTTKKYYGDINSTQCNNGDNPAINLEQAT